jgi:hypothetical protein
LNPFRYRPQNPTADVDHDGEVPDWEDNWLSNALAWGSTTFIPGWCQNEVHWTAKVTTYLFTSCPCCMFFRGLFFGAIVSVPLWLLILTLVWFSS